MNTRRARGDGGLHWDETRQRWIATITTGWKPNGKRVTVKRSGRNKTEARNKLRQALKDFENGALTSSTITIKEAVTDWLLYGLPGRDEKTVDVLWFYSKNHIFPGLGACKIHNLQVRDVEQWLARKAKTLSTRSLGTLRSCLRRAIARAISLDLAHRNVIDLVDIPQGRQGRPSKSLALQQAKDVLEYTKQHRLHPYIVLSLLTGARPEELRALTWDHVNLTGNAQVNPPIPPHINVWRSVRKGGDTKTRKSRRSIALPELCVQALEQQQAQQAKYREDTGTAWTETGLVFTTSCGTQLDSANVRRDFRNALKSVPGINPQEWTPREMRHSFVSILSDSGTPLEEVSRLVGHAGTSVTETVYRKQIRPVLQTGATVMDAVFTEKR